VAIERRAMRKTKTAAASVPASMFRCAQTYFREVGQGSDRVIELPKEAALALDVVDGDEVWALALARHSRM
jgi:hypothetical protein